MRGSLTDSACRLGGFGLSNTAVLTKCGSYPHRSTPPAPDFDVPYYDLGGGIACADYRFGAGAQPTHTRASTAWTRLANGLWTSVAAGNLRSYYNEGGEYLGALFEQTSNNRCLWNRDLTKAVWTATGSPTIAKDGTGMDGVANSCSTMTCGAAGDTVMQTVVFGTLVNRQCSFWLKRLSGTGTIEITDDGVTWTDIASQLDITHFRFVAPPIQSLMVYNIGIRMTTPGDSIAIEMGNVENSNYNNAINCINTPIETGAAPVTRQVDALGAYDAVNISDTEGTVYFEASTLYTTNGIGGRNAVHLFSGGTSGIAYIAVSVVNSRITTTDGTAATTSSESSKDRLETSRRSAVSWGTASGVKWACYEGSLINPTGIASTSPFDGSMGTNAGVFVSRGTNAWRGCIKNLKIWKHQLDINVISAIVNRGGR